MPNQEPALEMERRPFGNGPVRVGTQGLFRLWLKTFVEPFPGATDRPWVSEDGIEKENLGILATHWKYCLTRSSESFNRINRILKYYKWIIAKLNSSQLRRHAGGKHGQGFCCRRLLFSYRNGVSGSTSAMSQVARRHMRTTPFKLIGIMKGVRYYFEVSTSMFSRTYDWGNHVSQSTVVNDRDMKR